MHSHAPNKYARNTNPTFPHISNHTPRINHIMQHQSLKRPHTHRHEDLVDRVVAVAPHVTKRPPDTTILLKAGVIDFGGVLEATLKGTTKRAKMAKWNGNLAAYLTSAANNGQWTQVRLSMVKSFGQESYCNLCKREKMRACQVRIRSSNQINVSF